MLEENTSTATTVSDQGSKSRFNQCIVHYMHSYYDKQKFLRTLRDQQEGHFNRQPQSFADELYEDLWLVNMLFTSIAYGIVKVLNVVTHVGCFLLLEAPVLLIESAIDGLKNLCGANSKSAEESENTASDKEEVFQPAVTRLIGFFATPKKEDIDSDFKIQTAVSPDPGI